MNKLIRHLFILTLSCAAMSAQAVTLYYDEASFLAALSSSTTIDFEAQAQDDTFNSGDTIDGAAFTFAFPGNSPLIIDSFFDTTSGTNYLGVDDGSYSFYGGDEFTVTPGDTLHAAGMYVIGSYFEDTSTNPPTIVPDNNADDFWLTTSEGDQVFNLADPDLVLTDGAAFFIGLIADDVSEYFDSFTFSSLADDYQFNIDDITYASVSTIPVPAAIWLFGSALIGLVGFGRKQSHM